MSSFRSSSENNLQPSFSEIVAVLCDFLWTVMKAFASFLLYFRDCEADIEALDIGAAVLSLVVRSDIRWFTDGFQSVQNVYTITSVDPQDYSDFLICLCALSWDLHCTDQRRPLESKQWSHKFLHHYELFRCSLLDVHILEARGPSKSNIKYKLDLYEPIFIYSLLLRSV